MHKTLTPFCGRILLFATMACLLCTMPKASQGSPQNPPKNAVLPEDSSKHKSQIIGCANFGQVRCDSANGGGISGYADATGLFQCLNTGNIAGERKIGGIAGYASGNSTDSAEIGHCFNSGLIRAGNSSGGLIGYSNQNLRIYSGYNIGNVTAAQSAGAIVGRKFHNDARFMNCYYDRQTCIPGAIGGQDSQNCAEGLYTRQMTGDSLRQAFGNAFWSYRANCYPSPQQWDSMPAVIGATSPVFLNGNERLDSVTDRFHLQTPQGQYWRSDDSTSVRIAGNEGIILKSDSNRLIFVGDGTSVFRQVPLLHTYRSVCRRIAFNANLGSGQMDTLEVCGNQPAIIPASLFTRTHFLFQGWSYGAGNAAVLQSGDTLFCTQDTTLYAVWSPDGTDSSHAIPINNLAELMAFRDAVNNYSKGEFKGVRNQSTGFRDIHFTLTADIDLDSLYASGTDWEPVGKSSSASFRGKFHGMGHRISHLYINTPTVNYKGLFGYLDSALVEDVTLAANDTIIGKQYCGGIAAYAANGSQILRCANHGYVEGKSTHIGGICGNMAKSDITDCHNTGNITGTEKVGGIAGYTNGNSARYTHILRCFNSGQILASKAAGGICGNSYSCTEITQVYQNGQVWADTIRGSIVGLKSQKSVSFRYCYYDMQISPLGAINGTDDSTAAGLSTSALTDSLPSGFDSRYWQQAQGYCPIPVSAATDTAARIAATPVFFAQGDNAMLVRNDFALNGCDWITWGAVPSNNIQINNCNVRITGSDSNIVLIASYLQTVYREIRISRLQLRTRCNIRLWANDSSNRHIILQAYLNDYLKLDTIPFQRAHKLLRGWSHTPQGTSMLTTADSILVLQDTSLYAVWGNDGQSREYALRIDNLNDWIAFRDAVNNYANGCYQGVYNRNSGFCGIHFALYAQLDLQTVCDSAHSWIPVGRNSSTPFRGNLEGNGHTIDNMVIDSANMDFAGLFGCMDSATVSGLELGVHSRVRGRSYVGGITGCARNSSNIRQCANHAPVTGSEEYIGGICGYMSQSTIRECYNAADIRGKDKVGGIVGYAGTASASSGSSALGTSNVSYCYNSHAVRGSQCTGGLIGFANGNTTLSRSYNSGQLFGAHYTGSIIGRKYSSQTSISQCVYDRQISRFAGINGKDPETATEGLPTLQMTGTLLQQLLDTLHWRYSESCYPLLQAMEQSPAAWVSVIPIFLSGNETTDSIAHDFILGERPEFIWESADPSVLRIEGFKAMLLDSDTLSIIVRFDSVISKKYDIHTIPDIVTRTPSIGQPRPECLIYPNPVTNLLHIRIAEPQAIPMRQLFLCDATGKIVLRQTIADNRCDLQLQDLPAGSYHIVLQDAEKRYWHFNITKK